MWLEIIRIVARKIQLARDKNGLEWDYLRFEMHLIRKVSSADAPGCSTHWNCFQPDWIKMVQFASQASPNIKLPKLVSLEFSCHINAWLYLYKIPLSNKNGQFTELFKACLDHKIQSAIASVRNFVVLAKRCCNEGGEWRLLSGARVGASIVQQCSPTPGGRWWEGCGEL